MTKQQLEEKVAALEIKIELLEKELSYFGEWEEKVSKALVELGKGDLLK